MNKIDNKIIWQIVELVEQAKTEPQILNGYPEPFQRLVKLSSTVGKIKAESIEDLETEIGVIYDEVQTLGQNINIEDQDAQTAYLKLKTQLMGKIVDLKERTYNMRNMKVFQDRVLAAIDSVMLPEQRTEIMKILEQ